MKIPNFLKFIISVILCFIAAGIGSIFTSSAIPVWYDTLRKPSFTPPGWLFAPVWSALYLMMGISLFLVWKTGVDSKVTKIGLLFFGGQLVLNALWSVVFFGMKSITGGLVMIIVLWILILITILLFYKVSEIAAYLLIPYILWVSFASVLNFFIFRLNP